MTNYENLKKHVRDIPDFPKPGVIFRDITPILADEELFRTMIYAMQHAAIDISPYPHTTHIIAAPESRGFIMASVLAFQMNAGFVPMRKPGKLPAKTLNCQYDLEYGSAELQIHADAIKPGQTVLIVDDVLATGGTLLAGCELVRQAGGILLGCVVLVDLVDLGGRKKIESAGIKIKTLLQY